MTRRGAGGFTLVEVLVALMIVAIGLAALMVAVSGVARTSGYLRDKTLAQWIALNRIAEVRLNLSKAASTTDTGTGEIDFAGRKWHFDTRYFDTTITSMKRISVRVYAGDAKTKGAPLVEATSFLGSALATPGSSNVDWTQGTTVATANQPNAATGATTPPIVPGGSATTNTTGSGTTTTPQTAPQSTPQTTPP